MSGTQETPQEVLMDEWLRVAKSLLAKQIVAKKISLGATSVWVKP